MPILKSWAKSDDLAASLDGRVARTKGSLNATLDGRVAQTKGSMDTGIVKMSWKKRGG